MNVPTFLDALEMTTVTFGDGSSITGRVTQLAPGSDGGFSVQHVEIADSGEKIPVQTLFVDYEKME